MLLKSKYRALSIFYFLQLKNVSQELWNFEINSYCAKWYTSEKYIQTKYVPLVNSDFVQRYIFSYLGMVEL